MYNNSKENNETKKKATLRGRKRERKMYVEVKDDRYVYAGQLSHITIDEHIQALELINCVRLFNSKENHTRLMLCDNSTIYTYYDHRVIVDVKSLQDLNSCLFSEILAKANSECLYSCN